MPNLPIFQTPDPVLQQLQTKWKSELNPVIQNALNQGQLIQGIKLVVGANTINHKLSRMQVGYIVTDQDAQASLYRSQPLNSTTLTLTSDNPCTISLWVF